MDGRPLGVVGAGTMGAGIAQVAAVGGFEVILFDVAEGASTRAIKRIDDLLGRAVERGRMSEPDAAAAAARITAAGAIEDLAGCFLVIEAVAEKLEIKQDLFKRLAEFVELNTVLATNTSSIPVTAIAGPVPGPERVVGMHFFNPVPLMKLVEVIAGLKTGEQSLAVAREAGRRMGRESIDAADGPGFVVNRVSRPFLLESQQLLSEGVADHATIDRAVRLGGGFRMGPFELSDLVGIDVGYEVAKSFFELGHGEPRWRPSSIPARMVAGGLLGRKSGHGYYVYAEDGSYREQDPPPQQPESAEGGVVILGDTPLAGQLRRLAGAAGFTLDPPAGEPALTIDARAFGAGSAPVGERIGPVIVLCAGNSLATAARGRDMVGFHVLPPLAQTHTVELTRGSGTSDETYARARQFFHSIGKHTIEVGDAPGLVLGRIACQLINEACFALQEGVADQDDIDTGVKLGLNYPRGLFEWLSAIGNTQVFATIDALQREIGGDRYRPAPNLRRAVLENRPLQ